MAVAHPAARLPPIPGRGLARREREATIQPWVPRNNHCLRMESLSLWKMNRYWLLPQGSGGLGPGYNATSCGACHAQPAPLGSSPSPTSPQVAKPNPQIAAATENGATNIIPTFITANGPVREVRFVRNSDGTPDGGVHNVWQGILGPDEFRTAPLWGSWAEAVLSA